MFDFGQFYCLGSVHKIAHFPIKTINFAKSLAYSYLYILFCIFHCTRSFCFAYLFNVYFISCNIGVYIYIYNDGFTLLVAYQYYFEYNLVYVHVRYWWLINSHYFSFQVIIAQSSSVFFLGYPRPRLTIGLRVWSKQSCPWVHFV